MKLLNITVSILLIPLLVAGDPQLSHDAKTLLKKPRLGLAEITWRSGARERAEIVRVTKSFVVVRQGASCQNVEPSRIATVNWGNESANSSAAGFLFELAAAPLELVAAPVVFIWLSVNLGNHALSTSDVLGLMAFIPLAAFWLPVYGVQQFAASHDSRLGSWESVQPSHTVERIRLAQPGPDSDRGEIVKQVAVIQTGRYRMENALLFTSYDDSADPETSVNVRFECNTLIMDAPGSQPLIAHPGQKALAPIVGRWSVGFGHPAPYVWEFRPDGTFQVEKFAQHLSGSYKKTKGGFDVFWNAASVPQEEWQIQAEDGRLLVTRDGKTTTFQHRTPFE